MASWQAEPKALAGDWWCYRQVSPDAPPLFHDAGNAETRQPLGRWHPADTQFIQYLSLEPAGAWAECARYFNLRTPDEADELRRDLWQLYVEEERIADLGSFDHFAECGLDPQLAIGEHDASQTLANELFTAGFRGVLTPSASYPKAKNLTLFGERFEIFDERDLSVVVNPRPDLFVACRRIASQAPVPREFCKSTVFGGKPHIDFERWKASH